MMKIVASDFEFRHASRINHDIANSSKVFMFYPKDVVETQRATVVFWVVQPWLDIDFLALFFNILGVGDWVVSASTAKLAFPNAIN